MVVVVLATEDICDAVRAALDVSLTDEMLPNSVILLDTFAGAAERAVRSRDPLYDSRTPAELLQLRTAIIYYTAANLVYSLPRLVSENFGTYHYQAKAVDQDELRDLLSSKAEGIIAAVVNAGSTDVPLRPVLFTGAFGHRGKF